MSFKDLSGEFCIWDNEIWYVDHSDVDVVGNGEEPSYFVLPPEYANSDKNEELFIKGNVDKMGYWVHCSDVESFHVLDYEKLVDETNYNLIILKEYEQMYPENISLKSPILKNKIIKE